MMKELVKIWLKVDTTDTDGDEAWSTLEHLEVENSWFGTEEGSGDEWCGAALWVEKDRANEVLSHYLSQERVLEAKIEVDEMGE
jgi:hypothetical protein